MKTIYIPKGQTVAYDTLETERLVVNGCLKVTHSLKTGTVSGSGVILAGTVSANDICAREIEAASVCCQRLAVRRLQAAEVIASERAAVSCYLSADYVKTDRLAAAMYEANRIDAREVVILSPKQRSLLRLLLVSALRSLWMSLTAPKTVKVLDAEYRQVSEESPAERPETEPRDEELERIVSTFKLLRGTGYALKIVPGPREGDAPAFGLDTGQTDIAA